MSEKRQTLVLTIQALLLAACWALLFPFLRSLHREAASRLAEAEAREQRERALAARKQDVVNLTRMLSSGLAEARRMTLAPAESTMLSQRLAKVCTLSGVRLERVAQSGVTDVRVSGAGKRPVAREISWYVAVAGPWPACLRFLILQARRMPDLFIAQINIENLSPDAGEVRMVLEMATVQVPTGH